MSMTPHHPTNASLRGIRLFRNFDPSELDELLEFAEPCVIPAGRDIVFEGDSGHSIFVVTDGEAVAVMRQPDGTELNVARFRAGDVFGALALLENSSRNADVIAVTDCMVMTITTGLMRMFGLAHPRPAFKLAMAVIELAGQRLHATSQRCADSRNVVSALAAGGAALVERRVA